MKILQLANTRWLNAAADYALRVSAGLRARGHEVHFAGLPSTKPLAAAEDIGLPAFTLPLLNSGNPAAWLSTYRRIRKLVSSEKYDLVCTHFSEGYPILAAAVRVSSRRTVLVRTRGDMRPPRGGIFNRKLYDKWTDGLVASGEVVKNMITGSLRLDGSKVRVIYYGTDIDTCRPRSVAPILPGGGIPEGAPVVGYVGRLGSVKGEYYLLKAFSLIAASADNVRFLVAVKEEEGQPDKFIAGLEKTGLINRTVVLGEVENAAEVMSFFDVGIVSSTASEVNCRVLQEMMACAVPTVATRVGVMPEVAINGETGYLVPPRDPEAISRATTRILKDKRLRHKMAKLSRRRIVEKFSLEMMLDNTENWYRELRSRKGAGVDL